MKSVAALVVAIVCALAAPCAKAAVDVFICFQAGNVAGVPTVPGSGTDDGFPASAGWFKIKGVSLGIENKVILGSTSGGIGAGKAAFNPVLIDKLVDQASVPLLTAAATGAHYDKAIIAFRKSGDSRAAAFLTIELRTVFVQSIQTTESEGDDQPSEKLTLMYGAQKWSYRVQKPDGSLAPPVEHTWNQLTNSPNLPP